MPRTSQITAARHFWDHMHLPELRKKKFDLRRESMLRDVSERELPPHLARSDALRRELLWSNTWTHCDSFNFGFEEVPREPTSKHVLAAIRSRLSFDRLEYRAFRLPERSPSRSVWRLAFFSESLFLLY